MTLTYQTYEEDGTTFLDANCGCPACSENVQPGHFQCSPSPADLLEIEHYGEVTGDVPQIARAYVNGQWRWFITGR